jgi:GH24 family phage-related lysozyme (muramidase)
MKLVREVLYDDIYYYHILNESILNEEFNIEKLKDIISGIKNKGEVLNKFIKKFNETRDVNVKKHISTILLVLFTLNFMSNNSILNDISAVSTEVAKEKTIDAKKLHDITKSLYIINYKTVKASKEVKNLIKNHEKLRLTAYAIGDDQITIGYGHSYPENKSPYKVGDKISVEKAEKLFNNDIIMVENGLKRMFLEWEKERIYVKINQSMFDAMVSMAFNMGIGGLRKTEFIQHIKKGDFETAAERIKTTNTRSIIKDKNGESKYVNMPGLITRRQQERNLFMKGI